MIGDRHIPWSFCLDDRGRVDAEMGEGSGVDERKSTVNDVVVWPAAMVTFDGAEMREGVDVVIVTGTGTGCAVST